MSIKESQLKVGGKYKASSGVYEITRIDHENRKLYYHYKSSKSKYESRNDCYYSTFCSAVALTQKILKYNTKDI